MAERKLRAVEPGETLPARSRTRRSTQKKLSTLEAAEAGSRLEELRAMRRRIATAIDDPNTPARDLAALSRRQIEIGREVEALELRAKEEADRDEAVGDEAFDPSTL